MSRAHKLIHRTTLDILLSVIQCQSFEHALRKHLAPFTTRVDAWTVLLKLFIIVGETKPTWNTTNESGQ